MGRIFKNHDCKITSPYGQRDSGFHNGIDVVAKGNNNESLFDDVVAHTSGIVEISTFDKSYGNFVKIKHSNGMHTLYAHMERLNVSAGQSVAQEQSIGYMGNTGHSFGAHTHFEVRDINDIRIDPTPYLNADLPSTELLNVDGDWGSKTTTRLQQYFGTIVDGKISKPSMLISTIQNALGVPKTGYLDSVTIRAMQTHFGTIVDGVISKPDSMMVRAMQTALNNNTF